MAFVSMLFMYLTIFLLICLCILSVIALTGLIILIVSLVKRHVAKKRGMPPKKAGLIVGIVLLCIPLALAEFIVIAFKISQISSAIDQRRDNTVQYQSTELY
ncbi:MAG: hypothetical protein NC180_00590 [Muribaculaceae bacterium]|nr:hypothetical protein [Roseburia sp.]MCM1430929.1 hypothetical protein [Muribaculaceae bacterium]MCM1491710.1 hypothetical protein [Muribaculaceae bacterium]